MYGARRLREKLKQGWSEKTCNTRLNQTAKKIAIALEDTPTADIIPIIDKQIRDFDAFRFEPSLLTPQFTNLGA